MVEVMDRVPNAYKILVLIFLSFFLVQCGNEASFQEKQDPVQEKGGNEGHVPDPGEIPEEGDVGDDKDPDPVVRKFRKWCAPIREPLNAQGKDIELKRRFGIKVIQEANSVIADDIFGIFLVKKTNRLEVDNARGVFLGRSSVIPFVDGSSGKMIFSSNEFGNLDDMRGVTCIGSTKVGTIDDGRGLLVVIGPKDDKASLEEISNHRGPIILVNVEANTVKDSQGVLFLINSSVTNLQNYDGKVKDIVRP